jgi:UDP-N-acetylmuramate--alanine ligase
MITREKQCIAVAGTHGKTTVSTMINHLFTVAGLSSSALLGGISKNYETNAIINKDSEWVITEADEYDRSFLQLNPAMAVITACDADHLDIYGTAGELRKAFEEFIKRIRPGGTLLIKYGLDLDLSGRDDLKFLSYSMDDDRADFYAQDIRLEDRYYHFAVSSPGGFSYYLRNGYPGLINVENAVAVAAVGYLNDLDQKVVREALETFTGVERRFDIRVEKKDVVYIDDYAHHPRELEAFIGSVRELYPDRKITGVFQPHLYSRTKDLADEFADSLSGLDELILLDIYPAREKPVEGVTSRLIYDKIADSNKMMCTKEELLSILKKRSPEVLLTIGAGDIDQLVEPVRLWINSRK